MNIKLKMQTKHLAGCLKCGKHSIDVRYYSFVFCLNTVLFWKLHSSSWWNYFLFTFLDSEIVLSPNFLPSYSHFHHLGNKMTFQDVNLRSPHIDGEPVQVLTGPWVARTFYTTFQQFPTVLVLRVFQSLTSVPFTGLMPICLFSPQWP